MSTGLGEGVNQLQPTNTGKDRTTVKLCDARTLFQLATLHRLHAPRAEREFPQRSASERRGTTDCCHIGNPQANGQLVEGSDVNRTERDS
jgi:hypothetical protein